MRDLIKRVSCPSGCQTPIFTESTKIINENTSNLLMEGAQSSAKIVKVYNCMCCGSIFEIYQPKANNLLL